MSTLRCFFTDTGVVFDEAISKPIFETLNNVINQQEKYINSEWLFFVGQNDFRGSIKLAEVDWKNSHARLEISWTSDNPKEVSQALEWMVAALFSKVDINKFHAQIEQDSMLERAFSDAGFKREVLLRKHAFIDGCYKNISWMGICRDMVKNI
ncbi:MAG TPA: hypothetical protein PKV16_06970 [Caldisericia bacterium]|nr:hypothetical protein [Caldisericia bacterium]HPF49509.1 hypothetical protein [Caldisericia bacterium]HPI84197.1 hypothetical protein [Caldisericia bacterium]HPQ93508.1 hypothetical protein [Caldisericia bacterium]HRV75486.1 hypothetical protein [Caldisericia bacterium]